MGGRGGGFQLNNIFPNYIFLTFTTKKYICCFKFCKIAVIFIVFIQHRLLQHLCSNCSSIRNKQQRAVCQWQLQHAACIIHIKTQQLKQPWLLRNCFLGARFFTVELECTCVCCNFIFTVDTVFIY